MSTRRWMIYAGYLPPILFWVTNILCGLWLPGYHHATRLVSELGELGTPTQHLFTTGLVLCGVFSIVFIAGLYMTAKRAGISVVPILILFTYSFSILGAGLFPFPLKMHELLGMPVIVLFLAPLTAILFWRNKGIPNLILFSLLSLVIMCLGFLVYVPRVMENFFGIKQRFFHAGWTIWFIYLSRVFGFIRFDKSARSDPFTQEVEH